MPGVNFDRAASFYDLTRHLPEGVAARVRDAIIELVGAGPEARFLEVGVGTGRIALPFALAGYSYWGVDLSGEMLRVLRQKLADRRTGPAPVRLARADATSLPFRDASFEAVLMIHVLHLVDDARRALIESRRVLRPAGRLIVSANEFAERNRRDKAARRMATGGRLVTNRWNGILKELGVDRDSGFQRWLDDETMSAALSEIGATVERVVLARYRESARTPREAAAAHRDRVFSSDWDIPDAIHAEASRRLAHWLDAEHPAPDTPSSEEVAFVVLVGTLRP